MSRSRKKVWGFVDRNPYMKQQANKKVRRTFDIPNGKYYRKIGNSYDICDHKWLAFNHKDIGDWVDEPWKLYMK